MRQAPGPGPALRASRALRVALALLACSASMVSCSALLDWSEFTDRGPHSDAGHVDATVDHDAETDGNLDAGEDAVIDATPLVACGVDMLCSPALPSAPNWAGPYLLLSAGNPASLPSCDPSGDGGQPAFEGNAGFDAGPAQCGCSCSAPQGLGCAPPTVTFFADSICSAPCGASTPTPISLAGCVPTGTCTALEISSPTPAGGACAPDASKTVPTLSWSTAARACATTGAPRGSCGTNERCLPATAPFCIMHPDDVPCPTVGDYPFRRVYYQGSSDQRDCSECSCSAPSGGRCSYPSAVPPVFSYGPPAPSPPSCAVPAGMPYFAPTTPACTGILGTIGALQVNVEAGLLDAGSCQATGAAPTGAATPTLPTTFCCTR